MYNLIRAQKNIKALVDNLALTVSTRSSEWLMHGTYRTCSRVGYGIDDLLVCLRIFVLSEYHNPPLQLYECKEHQYDTCTRGNVL